MKENDFGKNLQYLRKEKGLSQKELGNIFNVCNQTISAWERGSAEPDIKTLIDFSCFFKISLDCLLGKED